VFWHDGNVAAAIGLSGPSPRFTDDRLKEWDCMLRDEALSVSFQLGWEDTSTPELQVAAATA